MAGPNQVLVFVRHHRNRVEKKKKKKVKGKTDIQSRGKKILIVKEKGKETREGHIEAG